LDNIISASLIEQIHKKDGKFIIATAGGGASAISSLLDVAGASNTVLSASVPYHQDELSQYLGGTPDQACSSATARALAMTAWQRARQIEDEVPVFGIGFTAALATNRMRRGDDRCFLAIQSRDETSLTEIIFDKTNRTRAEEEQLCCALIVGAMAESLGIEARYQSHFRESDTFIHSRQIAPESWQAVMLDKVHSTTADNPPAIVFPGAFNPIHDGHIAMAKYAQQRLGKDVCMELSIYNVDKPPLDYIEMQSRLTGMQEWPLSFTKAPTFVEKCRIFPGATFMVGTDTLIRISDKKYYNDSADKCITALKEINAMGNRFLVFGRQSSAGFTTLQDLDIPSILLEICDAVDETDFREDISSSQIRANLSS
jgi:nicotinamide mononucleotide (NMN) deamidase PncC